MNDLIQRDKWSLSTWFLGLRVSTVDISDQSEGAALRESASCGEAHQVPMERSGRLCESFELSRLYKSMCLSYHNIWRWSFDIFDFYKWVKRISFFCLTLRLICKEYLHFYSSLFLPKLYLFLKPYIQQWEVLLSKKCIVCPEYHFLIS